MITPQQRTLAKAILDHATENNPDLDGHTESLIRVLGSVIEGVPVMRAMGAPGDWGYGTPIGDAVLEILRENIQTEGPAESGPSNPERPMNEPIEINGGAEAGSSPVPCSRTDSDRLDFLEKHFEQLWRRGQPDMGGCEILLKVRIPGRSPSQHLAHSPTVRMAIDDCMDLLPANSEVCNRESNL